ncbi:MAG TPA: SLC13 family permease [Micrococcaceae bacterium]|nr:SLC13 family permease [Micrococcaceae bacterium]
MRLAVIGTFLLAAGVASILTGVLPLSDVGTLADRVVPVLVFVAAITVVTELLSSAGLFIWFARRFRHWGRGRSVVLWLLVAAFAVAATIFLSLDTTAVLLTPVVVTVARQAGLPPLPFALTTVWLANTASLLLPVSNLTNLLAQHALAGSSPGRFAALMAAPAAVAVVIPLAFIGIVFRRSLAKRYSRVPVSRIRAIAPAGADGSPGAVGSPASVGSPGAVSSPGAVGSPAEARPWQDRLLLGVSAAVLALLLPALVSGVAVWIPTSIAALVLAAAFLVRDRSALTPLLIPWPMLLFASGLFLVMETLQRLGASMLLGTLAGTGEGPVDLVRLAAVGAAGANLLNNLPAYLLAEPLAATPVRLAALLVGANAGPLITPWASLATLLWHERLRRMNVLISWWGYALFGLVAAPLTVLGSVLVLAWLHG